MSYIGSYLATIGNLSLRDSIRECSNRFVDQYGEAQSQKSAWYALLLGHVQSGKTGQLLGVISALADKGMCNYLLLTTDNRRLQAQTLERAQRSLPGFLVVGETDDVSFMTAPPGKPVVVVLKKNARVLQSWRNTILATARCKGVPLVIVDDEADATSLNTRVNEGSISRINRLLGDIRGDACKCLYIQVTATPQAVLLQSSLSGWRPEYVLAVRPGRGYLGGRYYFSDPPSHAVRFTQEDEATVIAKGGPGLASGFVDSVFTFLVNCAQTVLSGGTCCNFLVHPSIRVGSHNAFVRRYEEYLHDLAAKTRTAVFKDELEKRWYDLHSTYPEIQPFHLVLNVVSELLASRRIKVFSINSRSDGNTSYDDGFNVVVGGNSLGRGLTLPRLQVMYYCRTSKSPQADTIWQHSRMFGYDRTRGLVRIFLPPSVHKIFYNICESNEVLFKQIEEKGVEGVQLVFPDGVRPTRKCVIDRDLLSLVQGGVNFFPVEPSQDNVEVLDVSLKGITGTEPREVPFPVMLEILDQLGEYEAEDWDRHKFETCVRATAKMSTSARCKLIVRRNRDIRKNTGSLLSPNDRELVDSLTEDVALVLYRLNGAVSQGWEGRPFWVPNIRFPDGLTYYSEL